MLWTKPESYIIIKPENIVKAIKFIVVKKESQIPQIINHIRKSKKIFGTIGINEDQREILISRVLSFDVIEQNF